MPSPGLRNGRVRTPTLLQIETTESGPAALGILLSHYGRFVPLTELRKSCGVSRDGSKASNILKAGKMYGLIAKGFKKELTELASLRYPYIVFWHFKHFLVVEGYRRGKVFLNDPASGPRTVTLDEFDEGYTGVVITMERGPEFRKGGRRPSVAGGLWQRLRPSVGAFSMCAFASLLLVLPRLAVPALTQVFIDDVLVRRMQDWARPLIFGMMFAVIAHGLLVSVQFGLMRKLKLRLSVSMTGKFVWHLLRLPADYYAHRFPAEVAFRIALNDKVAEVLSGRMPGTVIDTFMMIFYGIVMLQFDGTLTLIAIACAAVSFLILQWVSRLRIDMSQRLGNDRGKLNGTGMSGLQAIRTIKASSLESDLFARWAGQYAKVTNTHQSLEISNQFLSLLPRFVNSGMAVVILVVGGAHVMEGKLSLGMLVAFQGLAVNFLHPVNTLLELGGALQELDADITRLDDVLATPTISHSSAAETMMVSDSTKLMGQLELRNVTFGYSPVAPPVIENFSLNISPGQRVALVGGTGSGKSTIARLIAGLHQPVSGEILFDGQPRAAVPTAVMTNSLALVDQEILLFGGPVRDNITLWDSTLPDSQITDACRDAAIHDAVTALPDGYNSRLLEGAANLSGGQRQRLEIARALAINPSILILDEATSALDAETERIIDRNIRRRGCSVIIVAHRLSTIRDADEIIVLDRGQVVQRGTHDELMGSGGFYHELISSEDAVAGAHV